MKRKILFCIIIIAVSIGFISCNNNATKIAELQSQLEVLKQENETLKGQSSISNSLQEQTVESSSETKNNSFDTFEDFNLTVIEKNIRQQDYSEFIELVFTVQNESDKEIKGIEGTLYIKDMFGKSILNIGLDVLETIPANSTKTFRNKGIDYNRFMDKHERVYNANYDSLIFEYRFKTVMLSDGTVIK